MSVGACAIHEAGHILALVHEKKRLERLTFYGGGIKIKYETNLDASFLLITAGSLINIAAFVVFYFMFPQRLELKLFAVINLIIGVFNLLPLSFFDGGRLLEKILIKLLPAEKALSIARKTERITAGLAFILPVLLFAVGKINPTVVIALVYVIIADILR